MADSKTPTLFNSKTRTPESVPIDQLEDSIISGTHSYASDADVNVVGQDGRARSVKAEDLPSVLSDGYKIEKPDQYAIRKYLEENKGASGAIKSFGHSLVNEAALGIPEVVLDHTQDSLEVAKRRALSKQHDLASIAGGIGGFGASLAYGGPLFKFAEKVGAPAARAVAEQVAKGLASVGMKSGAKEAAAKILTKAAEKATQLGVEGAVISAPKAITEGMLGDPEQAAETLLMGGGIGAALGLTGGLAGQTYKEVGKAAGRMASEREAAAIVKSGAEVPETLAKRASGELETSPREIFSSVLGKKKANAAEIQSAAEAEGVPLFVGTTEDSKFIQDASSNLQSRPTFAGVKFQEEAQKTYNGIQNASERMLGKADDIASGDITRARAGQAAKDAIKEEIGTRAGNFEERYGAIDEKIGGFAVDPETSGSILGRIKKDKIFSLESQAPLASSAQKYLNDLEKAGSLKEVSELRTLVGNAERSARRTGDDTAARVYNDIYKSATELREKTISENIRLMGLKGAKGREGAEILKKELSETDQGYSEFKKFLKGISSELKIRGKDRRGQVIEALEAVSPDQLANKMFNLKNQKGLQFFAEHFPSAFDNVKMVYLSNLKQAITVDGKYNLGSMVRRLDALEPEVRTLILGEEGAKRFKNIKTLVQSLPDSANPSKTSYAQAFGRMFSPQGVVDNVNDALTYAALKSKDRVAGILKTEKAMKIAAEHLDTLPEVLDSSTARLSQSATSSVRRDQKALAALIRLFDDHEETPKNKQDAFEKASKKIQDSVVDPEDAAKKTGVLVNSFGETGAPGIGNALGMKTSVALQYLNKELPRPYAPQGLLNKDTFKPSTAQIAQFERKLGVVMNPMSVIEDLKSGTLTQDHMTALQTVYPKLYKQMQQRVFSWSQSRSKPVPYKLRLRLSLFMGLPMDGSVNQNSIFALQQSFAAPDEAQQSEMQGGFKGDLSFADQTEPGAEDMDRNESA